MPNTTFTFNKYNFNKATPDFMPDGEYSTDLRFNTVKKTIQLNNENYGRGEFTITVPSGIDFGSVHFSTPNGSVVSVSTDQNYLFRPHNPVDSKGQLMAISEEIFKNEEVSSSSVTYYVVVNGDPNNQTDLLNVSIALAKKGSIPSSNIDVALTYTCPTSNLYEYTVGLHTWSPYDASLSNPVLTTKLYSDTPISSWGTSSGGTRVYSSPYLNNPALNYFYGYNDGSTTKVFQVGNDWSRSFGVKFKYEVRVTTHWFFKRRTRQKRVTIGPTETLNATTNEPTSEACIEPTLKNVGRIRKIYQNGTSVPIPPQPQQYRYYMGYDSSNKYTANSGPFTEYSIAKQKHNPITGLIHAFMKHTRGLFNGYDKRISGDFDYMLGLGPLGLGVAAYALTGGAAIGWSSFTWCIMGCSPGGPFPYLALRIPGLSLSTGLASTLAWAWFAIGVLALIWALFKAFKPRTYTYQEDCRLFLHHFANTPYLNTGTALYRDDDLEHDNAGWYSDGVYYYQQTGTAGSRTITTKQLSGINAFIGHDDNENEVYEFKHSLPADDPTLVTDWYKLVLLPYCSGKPIPYCGGSTIFYSAALNHTIDTQCCEMEDCNTPVVISLPQGFSTSCIDQADADSKALEQFSASIDFAESHSVYTNTIDSSYITQMDVNFTHEIKEEDNPISLTVFFDNRSGSHAPVTTPLYYDFSGCQKVLPGYYAESGSGYPKHYYKVEQGQISAVYTQSTSTSTTVSPGNIPIITSYTGSSSNWYLKSQTYSQVVNYVQRTNDRTYNVYDLFGSIPYDLSAGHIISGSYSSGSFQKFPSFNNTGVTNTGSISEQGTGWYVPLNGWKPEINDAFFYQNTLGTFNGGGLLATSSTSTTICNDTIDTQYFYDGEGIVPAIGDKVYNSRNIEDPTSDGYIKYGSSQYLLLYDGVVANTISCNPDTEFSGSTTFSTSSLSTMCSKDITTWYDHDTTGGTGRWPVVGDILSDSNQSQIGNVMIKYLKTDDRNEYPESQILHVGSTGAVLQIIDCDRVGGGTTSLDVHIQVNDGPAGFDSSENPTSNSGIGSASDGFGFLQHQFDTNFSFGQRGWKVVGLLWKRTGASEAKVQMTIRYPEQNDIGNTPSTWDTLQITQPGSYGSGGGTTFSFNYSNATINSFSDNGYGDNVFYRYTWDQLTNPFDTHGEVVSVLLDTEAV